MPKYAVKLPAIRKTAKKMNPTEPKIKDSNPVIKLINIKINPMIKEEKAITVNLPNLFFI